MIELLHGFGAITSSWREVLQPLAATGDVIAYGRPGFGFTERSAVERQGTNPYGVPGNLELLDALLSQFAPGREVIVVGRSAGGLVAAEYARLNPDTVDRLVLVAPAVSTTGGLPGWLTPSVGLRQVQRPGPILVQCIATSGEKWLEQSFVDQSVLPDTVVPTSDTERLATELAVSDLVVIPGSGHLPHEEAPEQFVDALLGWLELLM